MIWKYLNMNYKFTALLIIMFICLTMFAKPAYPKNEYLNDYGSRCGELDMRVEAKKIQNIMIIDTIVIVVIMMVTVII